MAWASSSLPVPLSPSINTLLMLRLAILAVPMYGQYFTFRQYILKSELATAPLNR
jgi:hypothetical protein